MTKRAAPPTRNSIIEDIVARTGIDEEMIEQVVRTFYDRARLERPAASWHPRSADVSDLR